MSRPRLRHRANRQGEPPTAAAGRRRARAAFLAAVLLASLAGGAWAVADAGTPPRPHLAAARPLPPPEPLEVREPPPLPAHPKVVVALSPSQYAQRTSDQGTAESEPPASADSSKDRPPSDAEIRRELDQFRKHLSQGSPQVGPAAQVAGPGDAVAPQDAPSVVAQVIQAGNEIARFPYRWGGGHGAWRDTGYDCSGSVSFALAGAGLLSSPLDSTGFMHWGASGPGRWITIYANAGHAFMVVAGLRFDTGALRGPGHSRWQRTMRSTAGFVARHPPGL